MPRLPTVARSLAVGTLLFAATAIGCLENDHRLGWSFDFANDGLRTRARILQAEVREGGCSGRTLFSTQLTRAQTGQAPGSLKPGRYGFHGRARDDSCLWFAQGCSETTLPSDVALTIVLSEMKTPVPDPMCVAGGLDAGAPAEDAGGGADEGGALPDPDAGGPGGIDAGSFDPSAPKCTALDTALVACFDFDGNVRDATSFGNDAEGPGVLFEPSLSGQAVRVNGNRLAVRDSASLDFSDAFTIECWVRADSLINLAGELNEASLLIDNDQQYNAGFDPHGDPAFEVYRAENDAERTTAEVGDVVVGTWTYLAFSYDGARARVFQDGSERDSEAFNFSPFTGNGNDMHIGSGSPNSTRTFNGLFDALRLWNIARTPADICAAAGKRFVGNVCE